MNKSKKKQKKKRKRKGKITNQNKSEDPMPRRFNANNMSWWQHKDTFTTKNEQRQFRTNKQRKSKAKQTNKCRHT
jgi:hypothetical protein